MCTKKFSYREFIEMVLAHLVLYKQKTMPELGNGEFRGEEKAHILPKEERNRNLLPLAVGLPESSYHSYSHHLNSSQMMCINFFSPLFNDKNMLLDLICHQLNITRVDGMQIKEAEFEYIPHGKGKKYTNFDFYVELTTGEKIYFEIKYTENGFRGVKIDANNHKKYNLKWGDFYKKQVERSMHLRGISYEEFYSRYQINRNLAYITSENATKEYVCFVFPFDNTNVCKELKGINYQNVFKIDWNEFCKNALEVSQGTDYYNHYKQFEEKYLNY